MALPRYYSKRDLEKIRERRHEIQGRTDDLLMQFVGFKFSNAKATEYARHGFSRRMQTLNRCIQNLFRVVPAGTVRVPRKDRLQDATINLQAFYANAYGCVDNLAWIWVHERGLEKKLRRNEVGLQKQNAKVRESFSPELQNFLQTRDGWLNYLAEFRHALGHRIPPYIPPGSVRPKDVDVYNDLQRRMNEAVTRFDSIGYDDLLEEQMRLYVFQPLTTHSLNEATGTIRFHLQILVDFLTVEELAIKMLRELRKRAPEAMASPSPAAP